MMNDDEIIRLAVMYGGKKTSVSLDGLLASYVARHLGGIDELRNWAKGTVARLEAEWNESAASKPAGERVRAKTGLSRAVQREAFRLLIDGRNTDLRQREKGNHGEHSYSPEIADGQDPAN